MNKTWWIVLYCMWQWGGYRLELGIEASHCIAYADANRLNVLFTNMYDAVYLPNLVGDVCIILYLNFCWWNKVVQDVVMDPHVYDQVLVWHA